MTKTINTAIAGFTLREAGEDDAGTIRAMLRGLATADGVERYPTAPEEQIRDAMIRRGAAEAVIAEYEGEPVGLALYYPTYSSSLALQNLYLEDFYIKGEYRSKGLGLEIIKYLSRLVKERGYGRLEWMVLNDNTRAIRFYDSIGATVMDMLTLYHLKGEALDKLAEL